MYLIVTRKNYIHCEIKSLSEQSVNTKIKSVDLFSNKYGDNPFSAKSMDENTLDLLTTKENYLFLTLF